MNQIQKFRERQNLTQERLAEKLRMDRSTVAKWETGMSSPRTETLIKLAKILSCTIDDLLGVMQTENVSNKTEGTE